MMGLTPAGGGKAGSTRVLDFAELARLRRAEAEELLLGDAGATRLLGDARGRHRHPADRRGAGGRRRRLPAEVHRRLQRRCATPGARCSWSPTTCARSSATATGRCCSNGGQDRGARRPAARSRAATSSSTSTSRSPTRSGAAGAHRGAGPAPRRCNLARHLARGCRRDPDAERRAGRGDSASMRSSRSGATYPGPMISFVFSDPNGIDIFGFGQALEDRRLDPRATDGGAAHPLRRDAAQPARRRTLRRRLLGPPRRQPRRGDRASSPTHSTSSSTAGRCPLAWSASTTRSTCGSTRAVPGERDAVAGAGARAPRSCARSRVRRRSAAAGGASSSCSG